MLGQWMAVQVERQFLADLCESEDTQVADAQKLLIAQCGDFGNGAQPGTSEAIIGAG